MGNIVSLTNISGVLISVSRYLLIICLRIYQYAIKIEKYTFNHT